MVSKKRQKQLLEARAARSFPSKIKRQKLSENSVALSTSATPFVTQCTIQNNLEESEEESQDEAWYWNSSSEDDTLDLDRNIRDKDHQECFVEPKNTAVPQSPITTQPAIQQTPRSFFSMLSWKKDEDKHLRGTWGAGSQLSQERKIKTGKEFQKQASQSYSLTAMIEKNKAVIAE